MNNDLYSDLFEYSKIQNQPFYTHWEITSACNLVCKHCYLPKSPKTVGLQSALDTISYLEENGFLAVGLTGGEVLVHPHFSQIYRCLKEKGFLVTVYTNGTRITEDIARLFSQLPPYQLKISIYGTNEHTFSQLTQRRLFSRFEKSLTMLKEEGVEYELQTPLMRSNFYDIQDIEQFCKKHGVSYKIGTMIYVMIDGCRDNLLERLSAEEVVDYEAKDITMVEQWAKTQIANKNHGSRCLRCAAGKNSIVIDVDSHASFCGMLRSPRYYFHDSQSFRKAIDLLRDFRQEVEDMYSRSPCADCELAAFCLGCPAHSLLETGKPDSCIPYFREIALAKLAKIEHSIA